MTASTDDAPGLPRPSDGTAEIATRQASLIATFYGPREAPEPQPHHAKLYRSLARASADAVVPADWQDHLHGVLLRRFSLRSRGQHDATIIQLALNAPGVTAAAWDAMRNCLAEILDDDALSGLWRTACSPFGGLVQSGEHSRWRAPSCRVGICGCLTSQNTVTG